MTAPAIERSDAVGREGTSKALRAALLVLPLLASFGSLITLSGGFFGFRILAVILVLVTLLRFARAEPWGAADLCLLGAAGFTALSGALHLGLSRPWPSGAVSEYVALVLALALALAGRPLHRRDPGLALVVCRGWVLAALVATVIAAWEILTQQHLPNHPDAVGDQPSAGLGNPNALAVFLILACLWGAWVRRADPRRGWRTASWVQLVMTLPILWEGGARAAILIWVVCCAWLAWRRAVRNRDTVAKLVLCLLPGAAALAAAAAIPLVVTLFREVADPDRSGSVRLNLSLNGLRLAWESGGLGTGPGSFETELALLSGALPTGTQVNAHNVWLELMVQYGVLPLLLLLVWLVLTAVRSPTRDNPTGLAVAALLPLATLDSSLLPSAQFAMSLLTVAIVGRAVPGPGGPVQADGVPT